MKRWMTMAGAVGLLVMSLATPGAQAASKTLYVGTCKGPSPYTTIQSAVNAVHDDDFTIYVCPGTYNESVTVQNKDELTIRNYVVKNQPAPLIDAGGGVGADGFDVTDSNEVTIRGLRITNADTGIATSNSPKTEVRNTIISACGIGVYFLDHSDKSEAQQNTVTGCDGGIGTWGSDSVTIKQNTVNNMLDGFGVLDSDKTKVESNTATNGDGNAILLSTATRTSVRKNTTNFFEVGILVVDTSTNNTISENTAKNNSDAGVSVDSNSTNNTFKKNFLQGNGTDAVDQSTGSKTAGTGNTWSSNKCDTSVPGDLCGSAATARRAAISVPTDTIWRSHR